MSQHRNSSVEYANHFSELKNSWASSKNKGAYLDEESATEMVNRMGRKMEAHPEKYFDWVRAKSHAGFDPSGNSHHVFGFDEYGLYLAYELRPVYEDEIAPIQAVYYEFPDEVMSQFLKHWYDLKSIDIDEVYWSRFDREWYSFEWTKRIVGGQRRRALVKDGFIW